MEICGHPKEVWNRSETVWNCRKAAISADPTFVWKFVDIPKRSETGLKPSETVGKQLYPLILHLYENLWTSQRGLKQVWNCRKAAISTDPTFVWKFVDNPKRFETGLKPSETVGKQLSSTVPYYKVLLQYYSVLQSTTPVLFRTTKRSETGLKPSETVGKQLYPLILHLYGNLWTSQRGLKQVWNRLKL